MFVTVRHALDKVVKHRCSSTRSTFSVSRLCSCSSTPICCFSRWRCIASHKYNNERTQARRQQASFLQCYFLAGLSCMLCIQTCMTRYSCALRVTKVFSSCKSTGNSLHSCCRKTASVTPIHTLAFPWVEDAKDQEDILASVDEPLPNSGKSVPWYSTI